MDQCGYCYKPNDGTLKTVQLRSSPKEKWQPPILACKSCREYLLGSFRYYKEKE
jgi:hypothetical protein